MWRNGETKHCPNISLSFLCSLHPGLLKFFTVCTVTWKCKGTDCILPGFSKLASVQVLTKRMQEKENVLSHRCPLHDPLVSLYSAGRGRNWKSSEMDQKFSSFFSPPASSLSRHISQFCTWMQRSFVCFVMSVHCNCKPQWDTSVMESVYPIVDILDGGADNILPSGHLRSVITLHLPQPLSFRACRCIKGQGLEKMPDFKITSWLFPFCDSLLTW